jgi:adenylate cyclase
LPMTVAKIVGDALRVLFGAPGEQPDHAARAQRSQAR